MARRTATLERPAPFMPPRASADVRSREAHVMPSVVEEYGKPRPPAQPSAGSDPPPRVLPVSVETLQTLIRHLVVESEFARHMEVSPARTINKVPYLTERDKRTLSNLDPQIIQSLADAAQRYARAIGPKQKIGPAGIGMRGDPLGRIGQLDDFDPRGRGSGGGGRQLPPDVAGRFGHGRGTDPSPGGGAWGDDGTGGFGGLGRGWFSGRDVPGVGGSGPDLGRLNEGFGPRREFGQDQALALIAGMGRGPFGADPLVNARAWHRLHPGEAASDGGSDSGPADPSQYDTPPAPPPPKPAAPPSASGTGARPVPTAQLTNPAANKDAEKPKDGEKGEGHTGLEHAVATSNAAGAVGAMVGLALGRPDLAITFGTVGVFAGFAAGAGIHVFWERPADDGTTGTGPAGPRANYFAPALGLRPADDGSGPIGPWSRGLASSRAHRRSLRDDLMPAPDDPGGGGPSSHVFMPNPETGDPGNPHTRVVRAFSDMVGAIALLSSATTKSR